MKIAVCTATIGPNSDKLVEPAVVFPGVRYLCASDRPVDSPCWEWLKVEARESQSPVDLAREVKIRLHRHTDADFYIWMDAPFELLVDPAEFSGLLMRNDLLVFRHSFCRDIAEEAQEIVKRGLVDKGLLSEQLSAYRKEPPPGIPHCSTGFLVRRRDPRVIRFNNAWYGELVKYDHPRDQMSFEYAASNWEVIVHFLEGHYRDNPYVKFHEESTHHA